MFAQHVVAAGGGLRGIVGIHVHVGSVVLVQAAGQSGRQPAYARAHSNKVWQREQDVKSASTVVDDHAASRVPLKWSYAAHLSSWPCASKEAAAEPQIWP